MQIEINASINPAEDMTVYAEGKRISQPTNGIFSHFWDESDLCKILTEKQVKELEEGKYQFNVPTWQIRLLQGKRAAKDNTELRFLMQWD
jgi:hypothetical protein